MNREDRRNLMKQGVSKETADRLAQFDQPAKLKEVLSISRAVAQDVASEYVEDYRKRSAGVTMALMLQVELLKKLVIEKGLITEEEFNKKYEISAAEFERAQREYIEEQLKVMEDAKKDSPKVDAKVDMNPVGSVDLKIVK